MSEINLTDNNYVNVYSTMFTNIGYGFTKNCCICSQPDLAPQH